MILLWGKHVRRVKHAVAIAQAAVAYVRAENPENLAALRQAVVAMGTDSMC